MSQGKLSGAGMELFLSCTKRDIFLTFSFASAAEADAFAAELHKQVIAGHIHIDFGQRPEVSKETKQ